MTEKKQTRDKSKLAKLGLLITAILWGSSLTVVKGAADTFNPNFILMVRFALSAIILAIIFNKKVRSATKDDIKSGLIVGFFLFIAYSSQTLGVTYADPGRSAFLSASYCVIVPFLSWAVTRHRPDKYNIWAAIIAIIGIYLISKSGVEKGTSIFNASKEMLLGDGLALLSGFLFAAHIVAVNQFTKGKDPILMTIFQFASAAVLAAIVTLIFEDNSNMVVNSSRPVFELLYLAIFCTTVALLLQNIGQKYTDESSAAIILGFESVFGILIPVLLGIESLTPLSIAGFVLMFAAIMISETKLSFLHKDKVKTAA
ncbi:DMT family transporter [uncultured Anaerococcus sp.]|uniref:DMT family transporter n=1 Tax=uncultured Anaerococcus sp. TaxID=293428 RepID=UPI0025EDDF3C|nr:DMT family transporter [uncultured Anaerococcus sp.]